MRKLSTWRRVALTAWGPPRDPTAYGTLDVDVEAALAYLETLRERTGVKVSLTHLVGKAIACGVALVPEVNAFVSRGRLVERKTIDVFFQIFFEEREGGGADLGGAKVVEANEKDLVVIAKELAERRDAIRSGSDPETKKNAGSLARMPNALVGAAIRMGGFLSYDLGIDLSSFGIPFDAYGSVMVTNVGVFGLPVAMAPLSELSRVPLFLTVGSVRMAAGVVGSEVLPRRHVTIGVSFDHRVMDGYHAGKFGKRLLQILADPEKELGLPRPA